MRQKIPEIIYEDQDLVVCQKPAGIAVETARAGQQDMVSLLKNYRAQKGEEPYIAPVHRLDQPVEGVMVFAKNKKTAASLSGQMQSGAWSKDYLALVCGNLPAPEGVLEDFLLRDGRCNISRVVPKGTKRAKKARLAYETVSSDLLEKLFSGSGKSEEDPEHTVLLIHLLTGRHHQIRVQLAHAGMPVYADAKYGTGVSGQPAALCAFHLHFKHPGTGREMDFRVRPSWLGSSR